MSGNVRQLDQLNQEMVALHQLGQYQQALERAAQARELARQTLGETHPDYASCLNNLAELHETLGDFAAAEPLLQQALQIRRAALGENHPDYAQGLNNLAELYKAMGSYGAAEPLLQEAWRI